MDKISTTEYKAPDGKIKKLKYKTLHPLIKKDIDILFVGINPHPLGVEKDAYFSNSGALWNQLFEAGITAERVDCRTLLKLNMGITNIVLKPSITSLDVSKKDLKHGRNRLLKEIKFTKPKTICFIGKMPYLGLTEKNKCGYGWQDELIEGARCFVMMFPTFRCSKEKKMDVLINFPIGCKNLGIELPKSLQLRLSKY
ncbi:MAG: mismatch-specific DNA-glycosylase [Nanoarchaeota archaeon]|nr:mismatch-specific DNA-glycosylase [Nanoarchaeota archaeon]